MKHLGHVWSDAHDVAMYPRMNTNTTSRRLFLVVSGALVASACAGTSTAAETRPSPTEHAMQRILIVTTSHDRLGETGKPTGAYLPEVAHPWEVFTRAGFEVVFASIAGGAVPIDGRDGADAISSAFLNNATVARQLQTTASVQQVLDGGERFAAVFLAGGHGTMWDFPTSTALASLVGREVDEGAVVSAVCHGPAGLLAATRADGAAVVAGKRMAAFTNDEEAAVGLTSVVPFLLHDALAARGALLQPAPQWQNNVVVDGRLVTGQNPASAASVAEAVVAVLRRDRQQD